MTKTYRRPEELIGTTYKLKKIPGKCPSLNVTVNKDEEGNMREVIINIGKAGGCQNTIFEVLGRTISVALQDGIHPKRLIHTMKDSQCGMKNDDEYSCCIHRIANILEGELKEEENND